MQWLTRFQISPAWRKKLNCQGCITIRCSFEVEIVVFQQCSHCSHQILIELGLNIQLPICNELQTLIQVNIQDVTGNFGLEESIILDKYFPVKIVPSFCHLQPINWSKCCLMCASLASLQPSLSLRCEMQHPVANGKQN